MLRTLLVALLLSPGLAAQETLEELAEALGEALERIRQLEGEVADLRAERAPSEEDELEAMLQSLIVDEPLDSSQRTVFPSAQNPRIGIFMDAVAEAGNAEERLGEDGDRFSLREVEIDFRLPISPFAEGVLVSVFEDEGGGSFESSIEEGYANIALGPLLDSDSAAQAKLGRFRVPFGHDNKLHTHDLMQVDRPFAVTSQLGEEGLIGDGLEFTFPLAHSEDEDGLGSTTTLQLAVVNGELFTGDHSLLGELVADAGVTLDSDAPVVVARASQYVEIDTLSDVEVGVSYLDELGSGSIETDAGPDVSPKAYGVDATWRTRDDETGVGSWLLQGELIKSEFDGSAAVAGLPVGSDRAHGWFVTAQRQTTPTTYVGVRYGETQVVGTGDEVCDLSPYVSWYADEFFRLRLQGQRIDFDPAGAGSTTAHRLFLAATWNFGAHTPHPYWTNR